MTDADFKAWLTSPGSIRCVLVEAVVYSSGGEVTRYLASTNYVSTQTDTPPNTAYLPLIRGGVSISEELSIDGTASMSYGDIEVHNIDGSLDSWLDDVWTNRPVNVYVGDVRWAKSEFRHVFSGATASIGSREPTTLNLQLRDKLQRLNTPLSEQILGGTTDNKDQLVPLCFGEVHNVEPLLVDSATLKYKVHNGPIERIIEVRDNGVPVGFTPQVSSGTFTLTAAPAGTITASVQGDKNPTYSNDVGSLIKRIVTGYGKDADRFLYTDLDLVGFSAFISAHPQPVGVYIASKQNVLETCSALAASLGAHLVMGGDGRLKIVKIHLPAVGSVTEVGPDDMELGSIQVASRSDVVASIKLGYCRNYLVQDNLTTGIPEAHKDLYRKEWLTTTSTNSSVAYVYKLSTEVDQADTLLLTQNDATLEASRRLSIWSNQRTVIKFTGTSNLLIQELGSAMRVTHHRFGLQAGKLGQVVYLSKDWVSGRVDVGVML